MKQKVFLFGLIFIITNFLTGFSAYADAVDFQTARKAAHQKLFELSKAGILSIKNDKNIYYNKEGKALFYIFELNPSGYIVVTGDTDLPPVIAYSFENDYQLTGSQENILIKLLISDIKLRLKNIDNLPDKIIQQRNNDWQGLLNEEIIKKSSDLFQQWPPEGTTSTGGWLESNWTQSSPYNNFCPMDPVTNIRSVAGCPAVAMAMIVNYYETINDTYFTDDDDYYHAYAGRNYWIDDDFEDLDFPSFPTLNAHLDTLTNCYINHTTLKPDEKAALTFACGVAAHQVYTSSISGTFGVSQAYDAYMKFSFEDALLLDENDTALYTYLSQNMMDARPVHLAVVDPPGTMGHNVVIDGYNTDDYYHLNFGWGGSYNGWYLLPDEIPYGLTVIEGAIVNIAYPPVYTTILKNKLDIVDFSLEISPNPVKNYAEINYSLDEPANVVIEIFNITGLLVQTLVNDDMDDGICKYTWNLNCSGASKIKDGIYFCRLRVNDMSETKKFIIR
ncbi:MAG: C10 family peptidase [Bacteroidales bacterium]|nr:C10 family peptidase [Bacteroidales bacterium]